MNTKRQTVWLVSMLSLMVILSAYYLFTGETGSNKPAAEGSQPDSGLVSGTEEGAGEGDIKVNEVQQPSSSSAAPNSEMTDSTTGLSEKDEEVIRQLENQNAAAASNEVILRLQDDRSQKIAKETDRLYGIISDTNQKSEQASAAMESLTW
jgi:stage III sporulation protein AH